MRAKTKLSLVCVNMIIITLFLASLSYAKIDPQTLVGLWLFDEGKGNVLKDSSGKGNDGTIVGNPAWVDGVNGKALKLNGSSDWIEVADNASVAVGKNDFSVVAWVNPAELKQSGFVTKGAYCWKGGFILDMPDAAGTLRMETCAPAGGAGSLLSEAGVIVAGKWQFIAASVARGKDSFLYRDGEQVATISTLDASDLTQPYILYIGAITGCAQEMACPLNGSITEVAFFNGVALTKDDINTIMKEGLLGSITAVSSVGKLATTWATIKTHD